MEKTIYRIEMRSRPDPQDKYPSERRYSSSMVLGLSITFFSLGLLSFLMASLVSKSIFSATISENGTIIDNMTEISNLRLEKKVENDLNFTGRYDLKKPAALSIGTLLMGCGLTVAGITGIFAWTKWYIDRNITWFFLGCCFSTITASIALMLTILIKLDLLEGDNYDGNEELSSSLVLNVLITCAISLIWSALAAKVAFKGILSDYPEGAVYHNRSNKDFCSNKKVRNNNKESAGGKVVKIPPDILRNHNFGRLPEGLVIVLPEKRKDENLPNDESNAEYAERMEKFVSDQNN